MDNTTSSSQPSQSRPGAFDAGARAPRPAAGGTRREPDPGGCFATGGVVAGDAIAPDVRGSRHPGPICRCDPVLSDGSVRRRRIRAARCGARADHADDGADAARARAGIVAKAVELHALSQGLDRSLLARLPAPTGNSPSIEYCKAYARMGKRAERERQIRLIGEIGTRDCGVRAQTVSSARDCG